MANSHNLAINQVMSAVLWRGERLPNRISPKALTGIVTTETVAEYQAEVARRAAARQVQIADMVKTALPVGGRPQENIGAILRTLGETTGGSITQIQTQIRQQVSLLNLSAGGEAGAAS